jgi:tRNA pseudouridine55 synthase
MTGPHGVVLIDKPAGPTSHDVVADARRRLGTRQVGHAGTLDPAATGLLVLLCGEGAKLAPYVSGADKAYRAEIVLGRSTDTLDAEGATTASTELAADLAGELRALHEAVGAPAPRIRAAMAAELSRTEQVPPAYSAIKVRGVRSHALARAGRAAELAPRPARARSLRLVGARLAPEPALAIELEVSKGYYVRALARDLGERLGAPTHLASLRRTRSGSFSIDDAVAPSAVDARCVIPCAPAARAVMTAVCLDAEAERRARRGQPVPVGEGAGVPGPVALLDASGEHLIAVAAVAAGIAKVVRGFGLGA